MAYEWKYPYPVDAQKAGKELERINSKYNSLIPEQVVEESRDDDAVLHPCFEWNDAVAAEKYRVEQARHIIGSLVIQVENSTKTKDEVSKTIVTRAFVNVSEKRKGVYVPVQTALNRNDYRERVLKNALSELCMFQTKYSNLKELAEVNKAIDDFAEKLNGAGWL